MTGLVPQVHGRAFEDLAVLGAGEVSQMVFYCIPVLQGVEYDMGRAIAELTAGDMAVFDGDDGVFNVTVGQRVHHNLAVCTELQSKPVRDLAQGVQRKFLHHGYVAAFRLLGFSGSVYIKKIIA